MNPCVVIPVYNHGEALVGTLENLASYALPTIVVDDGSDEKTKAIVADLAATTDIELVSLPQNLGKGGAVMAGLRFAHERGFTHVLQIDARIALHAITRGLPILAVIFQKMIGGDNGIVCLKTIMHLPVDTVAP